MERQQAILGILKNLRGLDPLKELFWTQLNYQRINQPVSRRGWTETARQALADDPLLFAGGSEGNAFKVIYARLASEKLLYGLERPVVSRLLRDYEYALFVFSNDRQDQWHFLNVKYDGQTEKRRLYRRITVGRDERLRTASERLSLLDLASVSKDLFGLSPLAIQQQHDGAFDVEAVTKQFFDEYKAIFGILQDDLALQTKDRTWAHDYALQFLNRCMFLYFIQRKRWLGNDTEFLKSFWDAYNSSGQPKNSFFERWLTVLFFEAFNNKFHGGHRHFTPEIQEALALAPFLNGGLFQENRLDKQFSFSIGDSRFAQVLTFLERYNFTIAEDSPLDQEVAVDPEMIGKVYESLVNVSTEADERGDAGIFYTPRTEIDLMCRLALVDNLANHIGEGHKNLFYELVFALELDEKAAADQAVRKVQLWPSVEAHLNEITVLDPACGSGSFLVGMLSILDDLLGRASEQTGKQESHYDRRKRIIGNSLYGVDVMEWACHVAELRLWLSLIIDADFTREELHIRREPLLPHFSFKIRCGDSLVQEIGGISLGHLRSSHHLPAEMRRRVTELKAEKLKFYSNDSTCHFQTPGQLENEERRVFSLILDSREKEVQEEIKVLRRKAQGPQEEQIRLDGTVERRPQQIALEAAQTQKQIEALTSELDRVKSARDALKKSKHVPFVWDIAFVEIFEGEGSGFDVVVGNPPYVRQENIVDPRLPRELVTQENKKEYRAKLIRSVYQAFPDYFGYQVSKDLAQKNLDGRSDLYVFFYFHALSLLNGEGSFCFITSNSWLDVGYGASLQEFFLKRCRLRLVLDNEFRRSFASADINTVIVLSSAPSNGPDNLESVSRFAILKIPFEQAHSAVLFQEINEAKTRTIRNEYRVSPIKQGDLLAEGVGDGRRSLAGSEAYLGNKWGGKYLRAPDVFFVVLQKGSALLKQLSEYFEGERYLNTGGADGFFVLTDVAESSSQCFLIQNSNVTQRGAQPFEGEIEKKFLVPLVKDFTKNDKRLDIKGFDAHCFVVKDELTSRAKEYIRWGEQQGYNRRSVTKNQRPWYKPTVQMLSGAKILVPRSFSDTFTIYYNPKLYLSLRFYRLHPKVRHDIRLAAFLNSTLVALFFETLGNKSLGQGVLDFFMADFLSMRIPVVEAADIEVPFRRMCTRPILPIRKELGSRLTPDNKVRFEPPPDRKELDEIVFDALRLTRGEKDGIYEALVNLVEARLRKATSLDLKERKRRISAVDKTRGIWSDLALEAEVEDVED